ncbi:Gfo/Idh/MocA family oxidoreductase [Paenibacillus sp. HB172176]|uniref:Gfo/Idh/MocA family protein n=1 Tax=Paenibacillus sp. HB172176 TaxID=2493690 RepID=UPI001F0DBB94|nr:Gfo/Idh/MocA family oxidoreductase [Paenibacillus sp. HB172176]
MQRAVLDELREFEAYMSSSGRKEIRIGALGCPAILSRALLIPAREVEGVQVVGLANRTVSKAEALAESYGIARVYDNLHQVIADPGIDLVYIALSNELHAEWTVRAARAGKAVLVEKPICSHLSEWERIARAAEETGVQIYEGLMVRHHPWQQTLQSMISDGRYGRLIKTDTRISLTPKNNYRGNYRSDPAKGGGAFRDFGCYWLQFLQAVHGLEGGEFTGQSDFEGPGGCDWTFHAKAAFPDGLESKLVCSFEMPYKSRHVCHFEQATVTLGDFFRANVGHYKIKLTIEKKDDEHREQIEFEPMNYYTNQLKAVRDALIAGRPFESWNQVRERIDAADAVYQSALRNQMLKA